MDKNKDKGTADGLPLNMKGNIQDITGIDMSDVKVYYNSSKPAQLQAHAYAQGNEIHVAPGQERHLGHEAWHVVQQRQRDINPEVQHGGNPEQMAMIVTHRKPSSGG